MKPTACACGKLPAIILRTVKGIYTIRIQCACGRRGATLMYTKRGQRKLTLKVAIDGWNLGHTEGG